MSIRQRLNSVEKTAGVGSDIQIIIFRYFFLRKDAKGRVLRKDGEAEGHFRASIGGPNSPKAILVYLQLTTKSTRTLRPASKLSV